MTTPAGLDHVSDARGHAHREQDGEHESRDHRHDLHRVDLKGPARAGGARQRDRQRRGDARSDGPGQGRQEREGDRKADGLGGIAARAAVSFFARPTKAPRRRGLRLVAHGSSAPSPLPRTRR